MIENLPSPRKPFNPWHFIWITVVMSELFTALMNTIQHYVNPAMDLRFLLKVGAIDALFVPLIVAPIIIYFMRSESALKKINMQLAHEIDERKRIEEGLRESEEKFSLFMDYLPASVFIKDAEGRTLFVNKHMKENLGAHDWIGKTTLELYPQHIAEPMIADDEKTMSAGYHMIVENVPHVDGSDHIYQTQKFAIKRTGKASLLGGLALDITERKQAEKENKSLQAQLLHAKKMEAIGQLAGGVAHDFNNILTAIIGYGSILQAKMAANDPLRVNVDHMLQSAGRATQLTQSLLAFSRKQVMDMKPMIFNGIIAGQEQFLRRIIGEDIEMKTILRGDAAILADSGQIEQVLMNLAANARDAMPKGGRLTIETDLFEMTDSFISAHGFGTPGTYTVISISDTGMGMDEETKQKIFEPFFTTKEIGRGTGLGMAIVYGIIKQHKGFINVYSKIGKGTTFKIYLPVYRGKVERQGKTIDASPQTTGTETILIAEDDATLRTFLRDTLREHGYTVVIAEDGEDAIRKFLERKDEIQICVIDMIMPKKSGKDVYDAIQKIKSGTKVIFSSGYTADKVLQEGLPAESKFIAKPAPPQEFLKKIREVLDGYNTT